MKFMNLGDVLQTFDLFAGARATATGNGTGVDLQQYAGEVAIILATSAGGGTTPTLDVKIQDSADNSTFGDVSGAAFTQVTDAAASTQKLVLNKDELKRYVRAVRTIGGTSPTFDMAVVGVGQKKYPA